MIILGILLLYDFGWFQNVSMYNMDVATSKTGWGDASIIAIDNCLTFLPLTLHLSQDILFFGIPPINHRNMQLFEVPSINIQLVLQVSYFIEIC